MTTDCDIFFKTEMTPALLFFWSDFKSPYGNKIFPTKLNLINFLRFRCCISILSFWFGKFQKFTIPSTLVWKVDTIHCIQITGYLWRDNLAVLEKINCNRMIIGIAAIWKTHSTFCSCRLGNPAYQWKHIKYLVLFDLSVELLSHLIS